MPTDAELERLGKRSRERVDRAVETLLDRHEDVDYREFEEAGLDRIELDPSRWEDHEEIAEARWFAAPPTNVIDAIEDRVARWDRPDG